MDRPEPIPEETRRIALLVSCASVLQVVESMLPQPFPGVRLGLANAVTLVALADLGARAAIEVAVLRTVISALILGTFLSPTFVLSFGGALVSAAAMALVHRGIAGARRPVLSLVGVSLVGAAFHNATQLGLAYLLLIRHAGIFVLLPWLGLSAAVVGWITGLVASRACRRGDAEDVAGTDTGPATHDEDPRPGSGWPAGGFEPANSLLHRLPAPAKMIAALVLSVAVLCLTRLPLFAAVFVLLCALALAGRSLSLRWFSAVLRLRLFLAFSFLAPLLFTRTGAIVFQEGPLILTREGVEAGARVVGRVVLLTLTTSLLVRTTSPEDLSAGLRRLLSPLNVLGLPVGRTLTILSLAWSSLPGLWARACAIVRTRPLGRAPWKQIIPWLGDAIARLCRDPEAVPGAAARPGGTPFASSPGRE